MCVTDGQNYDSQDCSSIAASRGKNGTAFDTYSEMMAAMPTVNRPTADTVRPQRRGQLNKRDREKETWTACFRCDMPNMFNETSQLGIVFCVWMCRLYEHITQSTQTDEHLQTGLMRFEEGGGGSIRLLD